MSSANATRHKAWQDIMVARTNKVLMLERVDIVSY